MITDKLSNLVSEKLVFLSPDKEELWFQVDGGENKRKIQRKVIIGNTRVPTVTYHTDLYEIDYNKLKTVQLEVCTP